jgi:hypothetical protein
VASDAVPSVAPGQPNPHLIPPKVAHLSPAFPLGSNIDLHFCLSMSPHGDTCTPSTSRGSLPRFVWENITFGDWKETRTAEFNVQIPPVRLTAFLNYTGNAYGTFAQAVQHNTSLWADILITHAGASTDPRDPSFSRHRTVHFRKRWSFEPSYAMLCQRVYLSQS